MGIGSFTRPVDLYLALNFFEFVIARARVDECELLRSTASPWNIAGQQYFAQLQFRWNQLYLFLISDLFHLFLTDKYPSPRLSLQAWCCCEVTGRYKYGKWKKQTETYRHPKKQWHIMLIEQLRHRYKDKQPHRQNSPSNKHTERQALQLSIDGNTGPWQRQDQKNRSQFLHRSRLPII